jgi:hypothetical protein
LWSRPFGFGEGKEDVTFFEKKVTKKTLISPVFERPYCGRSKAGGIGSFFASFFAKKEDS